MLRILKICINLSVVFNLCACDYLSNSTDSLKLLCGASFQKTNSESTVLAISGGSGTPTDLVINVSESNSSVSETVVLATPLSPRGCVELLTSDGSKLWGYSRSTNTGFRIDKFKNQKSPIKISLEDLPTHSDPRLHCEKKIQIAKNSQDFLATWTSPGSHLFQDNWHIIRHGFSLKNEALDLSLPIHEDFSENEIPVELIKSGLAGTPLDGEYLLQYFTISASGETKSSKACEVVIDKTPPENTKGILTNTVFKHAEFLEFESDAADVMYYCFENHESKICKTDSDYKILVDKKVYPPGSGNWTLHYFYADHLGNRSAVNSHSVYFDDTPPTIKIAWTSPDLQGSIPYVKRINNTYDASITVTDDSDSVSGAGDFAPGLFCQVRLNSGNSSSSFADAICRAGPCKGERMNDWVSCDQNVSFSLPDETKKLNKSVVLQVKSADRAGNLGDNSIGALLIDDALLQWRPVKTIYSAGGRPYFFGKSESQDLFAFGYKVEQDEGPRTEIYINSPGSLHGFIKQQVFFRKGSTDIPVHVVEAVHIAAIGDSNPEYLWITHSAKGGNVASGIFKFDHKSPPVTVDAFFPIEYPELQGTIRPKIRRVKYDKFNKRLVLVVFSDSICDLIAFDGKEIKKLSSIDLPQMVCDFYPIELEVFSSSIFVYNQFPSLLPIWKYSLSTTGTVIGNEALSLSGYPVKFIDEDLVFTSSNNGDVAFLSKVKIEESGDRSIFTTQLPGDQIFNFYLRKDGTFLISASEKWYKLDQDKFVEAREGNLAEVSGSGHPEIYSDHTGKEYLAGPSGILEHVPPSFISMEKAPDGPHLPGSRFTKDNVPYYLNFQDRQIYLQKLTGKGWIQADSISVDIDSFGDFYTHDLGNTGEYSAYHVSMWDRIDVRIEPWSVINGGVLSSTSHLVADKSGNNWVDMSSSGLTRIDSSSKKFEYEFESEITGLYPMSETVLLTLNEGREGKKFNNTSNSFEPFILPEGKTVGITHDLNGNVYFLHEGADSTSISLFNGAWHLLIDRLEDKVPRNFPKKFLRIYSFGTRFVVCGHMGGLPFLIYSDATRQKWGYLDTFNSNLQYHLQSPYDECPDYPNIGFPDAPAPAGYMWFGHHLIPAL